METFFLDCALLPVRAFASFSAASLFGFIVRFDFDAFPFLSRGFCFLGWLAFDFVRFRGVSSDFMARGWWETMSWSANVRCFSRELLATPSGTAKHELLPVPSWSPKRGGAKVREG